MIKIIHTTVGVGVGLLTASSLFLLTKFADSGWILLIVLFIWTGLTVAGQYILHKLGLLRRDLPTLSFITMLALVGLLFFVEQESLRWFLIIFGPAIVGLLHAWSVQPHGYTTHIEKSYRRIIMMLWVFDAYAITTAMFAVDMFFGNISFWILSIISASVLSYISYMIWRMYYSIGFRRALIWVGCIWLLSFELVWVLRLLPFAYTVLGLFTTWLWYIIQLFFRFHFSRTGVDWKRQIKFLITSGVIMLVLLIFVVSWR